jgi:pimeloyl-ACP methyl ester carboxylesterase
VFDLSEQQFKASSKTWVYSLMASNVYREKGQVFVIPGWEVASRWKSPSGLTFEEWTHKDSGGKPDQIVVAFEGTKFSSLDDWQTNLSLIEPRQFREAYAYMDCLVKHRANGARIAVTGHSLGGALALNMSLRLPGIHAYVFDPSPRAFFKVKMKKVKADMRAGVAPERILVYESGEVLAFVRAPWQAAFRNFERYRFNFMDFTNFFAVVSEHNMYLIARGLLMAAIKAKDAQAGQAFTANLSSRDLEDAFKEEKEPGDKKYDIGRCQWIFQTYPVR